MKGKCMQELLSDPAHKAHLDNITDFMEIYRTGNYLPKINRLIIAMAGSDYFNDLEPGEREELLLYYFLLTAYAESTAFVLGNYFSPGLCMGLCRPAVVRQQTG